ncbi:MAG: thermonuclease family protein [Hyphomicrobiales bacterium]|nr:thermonuclease family protein [Hyphomicrobiales bacterium]MDE2115814.1 thermonuclease family protein [Hyphomicrobiales bacterium]
MRRVFATFVLCFGAAATHAAPVQQASPASWWAFPAAPIFVTGDTWQLGSETYRLYGVQACLRSTYFTNAHGIKHDCGEVSLGMLVSYVRTLKPLCTTIAHTPSTHETFVVCVASLTAGPNKGSRLDLGTALIAGGWAFAALAANGEPFHTAYGAAQNVAQNAHAGLWQFTDIPNPNATILNALRRAHIVTATKLASPHAAPPAH